jgi:CHAD domain-containing protein
MPAVAENELEVEWQFDVPGVEPVLRWLQSAAVPGYVVRAVGTKNLVDTYYDTADWRLHRAGFTCRVRQKGQGAELTLKSMAAAQDGVRTRRELNEPLGADASPADAPGQCGAMVRLIAGRRPLAPLFTLEQTRRLFMLADGTGDAAEIAVDETRVPGREATATLSRVEVEVAPGALERVRRFTGVLTVAAGLTPGTMSKFEAGMAAAGLVPLDPAAGLGPASVTATMTAGEAGYAVLRKHFAVFLANEGGTRLGEDIEGLHDMRVAARRMRAAMAAFAPWLPPRMARHRLELGWVAAALGTVRDLDVQLEQLREWQAGYAAGSDAFQAIEAVLTGRREAGRKRMLAVLDSRRYEQFVERFSRALRAGAPRSFHAGRVPVLAVAPDVIERRYRTVRRRGGRITPQSAPAAYHALRIDAKKLRYALEFLGPLYGKVLPGFVAKVTALQDILGEHQDAEVAVEMLHGLALSGGRRLGPVTMLAMGAISERYRVRAAELRGQFPAAFKALRGDAWAELRDALEARRPRPGAVVTG